jgi:hypothetical protein
MQIIDTDIRSAMLFRILFGTQDDHYIPAAAFHLLRGLAGLSEEDGRVGIELWAMDAGNALKEQVNQWTMTTTDTVYRTHLNFSVGLTSSNS